MEGKWGRTGRPRPALSRGEAEDSHVDRVPDHRAHRLEQQPRQQATPECPHALAPHNLAQAMQESRVPEILLRRTAGRARPRRGRRARRARALRPSAPLLANQARPDHVDGFGQNGGDDADEEADKRVLARRQGPVHHRATGHAEPLEGRKLDQGVGHVQGARRGPAGVEPAPPVRRQGGRDGVRGIWREAEL